MTCNPWAQDASESWALYTTGCWTESAPGTEINLEGLEGRGREAGRDEGREEGMEEGKKEGRKAGRKRVVVF